MILFDDDLIYNSSIECKLPTPQTILNLPKTGV